MGAGDFLLMIRCAQVLSQWTVTSRVFGVSVRLTKPTSHTKVLIRLRDSLSPTLGEGSSLTRNGKA